MEGGSLKTIDHWKVCVVDMVLEMLQSSRMQRGLWTSYTKRLRNGCKSASGTGTWGQKAGNAQLHVSAAPEQNVPGQSKAKLVEDSCS